jgi:hypothetical protein
VIDGRPPTADRPRSFVNANFRGLLDHKAINFLWELTREAGVSIKPGVERSGTPGTVDAFIQSPRSGRQRKEQIDVVKIATSIARSAGSGIFLGGFFLGFRCAPPQALCCRPLRGLT